MTDAWTEEWSISLVGFQYVCKKLNSNYKRMGFAVKLNLTPF